jgi:hypothetical protein
MAVEVQQSGSGCPQAPQSRHHREHDRAVAAEHESKVAARQQRLKPAGQLLQRRSRLADVLG